VQSIRSAGLPAILAAFILWAALAGGCGKKGPPVPPQRYRPPAVTDLSYELTDQRVRIQWTVAGPGDPQQAPVAGCAVYRAQRPLDENDCIDCRLSFQKTADVAVPKEASGTAGRQRLDFSDDLTPGFEYAYRVICSTAAGVSGKESNVVRFELPQPTTQQP
jgi:hypothetical protein